ncbi:hypothetical protein [Actinacidiphila alni]|uniref:hypothetical protein n=1 Tax=Actinacidiphila alni TaxID=380248 RepID=UPI0034565B24
MAEQTGAPPSVTATVAPGSAVPVTSGVAVTVAPSAGAVTVTGGAKPVASGTPSPVIRTATLCTVTCPPPSRQAVVGPLAATAVPESTITGPASAADSADQSDRTRPSGIRRRGMFRTGALQDCATRVVR